MKESSGINQNHVDKGYNEWLLKMQATFLAVLKSGENLLFTTDVEDLFKLYLFELPEDAKQEHTCNACRHFIERFGNLVTISPDGTTIPVLWNPSDAPAYYKAAAKEMYHKVRTARVTGVFISADKVWGQPKTGEWTHFSLTPPKEIVSSNRLLTPYQIMAEKKEDFKNMIVAMKEFPRPTIDAALHLLESDALYRAEKVIGPAKWMLELYEALKGAKGKHSRENILWRFVASAPVGFCHPRSSIIGTLLEDINAKLPMGDIKARFKEKMHPLKYQRPQSAPAAGQIKKAEEIVAKLGIEPSLHRRYARIDEVEALWKPEDDKSSALPGVFSHIKPKGIAAAEPREYLPHQKMTFTRFRRDILPNALEISIFVPNGKQNFAALVTAVNADAPPILQWDSPELRNPVSWYLWHGGSMPDNWGLKSGYYYKVSAVTLKPALWNGGEEKFKHQGLGVMFVIEGARETRKPSMCLFPEMLRNELREVRHTIEAYSKAGTIVEPENGSACGIMERDGTDWNLVVKVRTARGTSEYTLDRWE